ncbi:hypothetical protein O181_018770 [Austropuccinia psidii MF-1]|uniref:Uncharacterized protein n=1 Tax=Austropuccinia psidii MF-1 TaxID=1389203 RepID=A0A9Q3CAG3_9BASI|nr:hypothetical protein [Austropuccinia psidii MF-1]
MPVKHSPPAKNTRSQRHQPVLAPTGRSPLDCTPSVAQLSANLDGGPPMEGKISRARSRLGEAEDEEEYSEETEVETTLAGDCEAFEAPNIAPCNQPLVSQAEPNFLKMMEQMTQFVGQLTQTVALKGNFKSPSIQDSINEGT